MKYSFSSSRRQPQLNPAIPDQEIFKCVSGQLQVSACRIRLLWRLSLHVTCSAEPCKISLSKINSDIFSFQVVTIVKNTFGATLYTPFQSEVSAIRICNNPQQGYFNSSFRRWHAYSTRVSLFLSRSWTFTFSIDIGMWRGIHQFFFLRCTFISSPHLLTLFSRPWFIVLISLYPITQGTVWWTASLFGRCYRFTPGTFWQR